MSGLPQRLADGVAALRAGRPAQAVERLRPVWEDPDLAAAEDLRDVRARVGSLLSQALLEAGHPAEAEHFCRDAIRLLRSLRDRQGLDEVRGLQDRIVAALAQDAEQIARRAEQERIAATPLAELLPGAEDDAARADILVKKAHALGDVGKPEEAAALAREALVLARGLDDVRIEVLAHLALGRADPEHATEHHHAAYHRAERADEFNLVSTVAAAAKSAGVTLPVELGPHAPTQEK